MDDNIIPIAKLNNGAIKHGVSPRQNHLLSVFQSLERTLIDKKKKYSEKVESLIRAWEQIVTFVSEASKESKESPQPFFDNLFLNTLRFVLRADWPTSINTPTKTHLSVTLQRFTTVLKRCGLYSGILEQCRVLELIVKDPWGQKDASDKSALKKILQSEDVDQDACEEYFKLENGKVVVVRLEMLLLSKCEDIAVNLSKACLNTIERFNESLEEFDILDFTQNEIDYITDIYFSSLQKNKRKQELMIEFQKYQLGDGLELLKRYRKHSIGGKFNEHCKAARVWKNNAKIVELLSNTLLVNAILNEDLVESQSQLEELICEWAACLTVDGVLKPIAMESIRKFVLIAPSSKCLYPFCSFLIRNGNCKEQDFDMVARCLIRAINQNMNEVEQLRVDQERDKLKETYSQLSQGFMLLSDLLSECQNIYKECLLTSFSLTPTRECLRTIEAFVTKLANIADPSAEVESEVCQENEVGESISSSDAELQKPLSNDVNTTAAETVSEQCENSTIPLNNISASETPAAEDIKPFAASSSKELNEIFESMGVPKEDVAQIQEELESKQVNKQFHSTNGTSSAFITELENLKLDETVGGDLSTILSYRRYHTLTWDLEWPELKENCEQYLEDFEKKDFDDVELKYLDLDYNQFKDQPIIYDDLYGIEKGYEHYAYSTTDSEEEYSSTKRSGLSSIESDEDGYLIHRKRKRTLDSDSDEARNKKKRARKTKTRVEELRRRYSEKSDSGSNPEDDRIFGSIESAVAGSGRRKGRFNHVKALRVKKQRLFRERQKNGFYITSYRGAITHNTEFNEDELNDVAKDVLSDVSERLEGTKRSPTFEDPPIVPVDSDKLLPPLEVMFIEDGAEFNHDFFKPKPIKPEPAESAKPVEKPRKSIAKEKNPNAKKKGPKPGSKSKLPRPNNSNPTQSSSKTASHSTLLSNDKLFKKKYGSKPKKAGKSTENQPEYDADLSIRDAVVQLPKLDETFSQFQKKNNDVMKPIDQNVSFTSYLNNKLDKSSISSSGDVSKTSTSDANGSDSIEDIKNFIDSFKSPKCTPTHVSDLSQAFELQTTADRTCQTDISAPEVEEMETECRDSEYFFNASVSAYLTSTPGPVKPSPPPICALTPEFVKPSPPPAPICAPTPEPVNLSPPSICASTPEPVKLSSPPSCAPTPEFVHPSPPSIQNNVHKVIASMTSPIVRLPPINTIPPYTSNMCNGDTAVQQILQNYRKTVAENPKLKNIPAPRKRTNATKMPRKPRSRANKNDPQAANAKMHNNSKSNTSELTPSPVSQHSQQVSPSMQSGNTFPPINTFYTDDVTKYPPIYPSSQVVPCSAGQLSVENVCVRIPNDPNKHVSLFESNNGIEMGALKTLLMQGQTTSTSATKVELGPKQSPSNNLIFSTAPSPVTNQISYTAELTNGHHISPPIPRINNNVPRTQHNDTGMNTQNITYNSCDSSSQSSQKAAQQLRYYQGFTNDFEVRIPRIDFKVDPASFSTNNAPYSNSNKTTTSTSNLRNTRADNYHMNIPSSLLPQVVIPMLPETIRNHSSGNTLGNYQINNYNATPTVDYTSTNSRNIEVNGNSEVLINNMVDINHYSPAALFSTNTQNMKNELKFNADDVGDPNGVCISIAESPEFYGYYSSLIPDGAQMNENNLFNGSEFLF
ncbi:uncharacterized protein LOC135835735 [Planococcus citri]|uniref:uncharacterized protein LOC135835735 n=1 Tax=Planococcus citri TaxID=170843 RepID=UPI0031F8AF75